MAFVTGDDKRSWALRGLSVPRGVAMVTPRSPVPLPPVQRYALIGGRAADALRAPLGRIVTSSGATLHAFIGPQLPQLVERAAALRPDVLLLAAPRSPVQLLDTLALRHTWLGPSTFPTCCRPGTAMWYGAWAARIWDGLRRRLW